MDIFPILGIGLLRIVQTSLNKETSRHTTTLRRKLCFGIFFEAMAAIFSLVYLFVAGFGGLSWMTLLCATITGAGFLADLLTGQVALQSAPLVLFTLSALGGSVILPLIAGIFFFEEPMSLIRWLGVAIYFVAAWLLSAQGGGGESFRPRQALPILCVNFLINGALGIVGKYFAVAVKDGNAALFSCLSYASAAFFFGLVLLGKRGDRREHEEVLPGRVYGFGVVLGAVCATIVYSSTVLARIVTIAVLNIVPNVVCIVGSLLVGCLLYREKLTKRRMLGAILGIAAAVALLAA